MTWKNLYFYHSCCDVFKIFKFFNPLPIYDLFNFSERSHRSLYINTPQPSDSFEYRTRVMWLGAVCDRIENSDRTGPDWDNFGRNRTGLQARKS